MSAVQRIVYTFQVATSIARMKDSERPKLTTSGPERKLKKYLFENKIKFYNKIGTRIQKLKNIILFHNEWLQEN